MVLSEIECICAGQMQAKKQEKQTPTLPTNFPCSSSWLIGRWADDHGMSTGACFVEAQICYRDKNSESEDQEQGPLGGFRVGLGGWSDKNMAGCRKLPSNKVFVLILYINTVVTTRDAMPQSTVFLKAFWMTDHFHCLMCVCVCVSESAHKPSSLESRSP